MNKKKALIADIHIAIQDLGFGIVNFPPALYFALRSVFMNTKAKPQNTKLKDFLAKLPSLESECVYKYLKKRDHVMGFTLTNP